MSAVPKSEAILLREESGGICTLTMNRPAQMNLLTSEMLSALQSSFEEIAKHDKVRVVILAAAGKRGHLHADHEPAGADEPADLGDAFRPAVLFRGDRETRQGASGNPRCCRKGDRKS